MFGKVKVTKVIGGFGGLYIIYEWVGDLVFLWGDFFWGGEFYGGSIPKKSVPFLNPRTIFIAF
jgi:hypothetical protein